MKALTVNFILGASVYYESLLKESCRLGINTNWWAPLHNNIALPNESPYSGQQRRIFDKNIADKYNAVLRNEKWITEQTEGVFFVCEGIKSNIVKRNKNTHIFSFIVNTDFKILYPKYINNVDWVLLPNKHYVTYYNAAHGNQLDTCKNLYFGSTKYDNLNFNSKQIYEKYSIHSDMPVAIVFLPKPADINKVKLKKILNILKSKGFFVFTKSRPKDPISKKYWGDSFLETSYYPCTSLELISISDIVINFDSSVVEEAIMSEKNIINFAVKNSVKPLYFLYDNICAVNLLPPFNYDLFSSHIDRMRGNKFSDEFSKIKNTYLYQNGNIANKIIQFILSGNL